MTGIFLSERWNDLQSRVHLHSPSEYEVVLDANQNLHTVMTNILAIESVTPGFQFQMSLALKAGDRSAYDVLDMYSVTGGALSGSAPYYFTTETVQNDEVENACAFSASMGGNGETFGTGSFPEQCVLHQDGANTTCAAQPRIWGNDSSSTTANPLYVTAITQGLQDFVNLLDGASGYPTGYTHPFQAIKLGGIASHDEEIAINGNPYLGMPPNGTGYYYCGYTTAINAEQIWTNQIMTGPPFVDQYESGIMEATWLSLVAATTSVTYTGTGTISYIVDVLGDSQFPPVTPAHCSSASGNDCMYVPPYDSSIPHLTTGEMEYLIEQIISTGLLSGDNLAVQNEGLQAAVPNNQTWVDSDYTSKELPCAMNALAITPPGLAAPAAPRTKIGYQSAGITINSAATKIAYLQSISNGPAYGAQYIELIPSDLEDFVNDITDTIPFGSNPNYGSSEPENIDMLAQTMAAAQAAMATNAANSNSGTLCPRPLVRTEIGTMGGYVYSSIPFTYP